MKKLLFLKSSLASLVFCLLFLSGCENWGEGGVKLYNEMPSYALEYIDKKLKANKEVVLAAVKQDGTDLQYANKKL